MIGKTVSHYRITRMLGAGGMGVVYEAEDTKLKRTVALKFLPPETTRDPESKARFVREAQAASALDHPNVCTIFQIDETDDGQLFLAMARYEGETLKQRIERGPLPIDDAVDITRQVAEGLAKTHERKIVHRDIKPANIFLTDDGLVKILDFGLAKLSAETLVTRSESTMGTANYMSPEQARGGTADHQSDLWSLGVMLYEMITGRLPFFGEHPQATIYVILNKDPEPVTGLRAEVPLELERIIDKCLAKSTDQRIKSAGELVAALARLNHDSGSDSVIIIPGLTYQWHRHRWRWITGAVAVCVALAIVTWQQFGDGNKLVSGQEISIAVVGFRNLLEENPSTGSAALTSLVNVGLVESSPVRVVSPSFLYDQRRRLFGTARGPIGEGQAIEVARASGASLFLLGDLTYLGDEQVVTWQLIDTNSGGTIGAKRVVGGDLIRAADLVVAGVLPLVASEAGMDGIPEVPSVASMTTRSSDSFQFYVAGVRALEDQLYDVALDSLERAVAIDSTFAMAHLALSRLHHLRPGGIGDASGVRRHAEAAWENRFRLSRKERLRVEVWQAQRQARLPDVNDLFTQMLSEWPDDRDLISDRIDFLYYYWYFKDALQEVERALVSYPDDLDFLESQNAMLSALGEHDHSLRVARRCVALDPDVAANYLQLCARWLAVGEPDSAENAVRTALFLEPDYLLARIQLAQCQYVGGDLTGATMTLEEIAREADINPMDAVRVLTSSSFRPSLTMLYGEAGRHEEALAAFGRAEGLTRSAGTRLAIESRRHRYLLRQGRYRETLAWSNRVLFGQQNYAEWFNAQLNRVGALALADSVHAARLAAADLFSAADSLGGLSTFMARRGTIVLLLKTNQPKEALALIQEIREDGLPTGGMFDLEIRDSEIEALLLENRFDEAEHALYEQLRLYGGHAKAHLSLGRVLEEQGHPTEAAEHYRHFIEAWAKADPDLPQVVEAKERLERL